MPDFHPLLTSSQVALRVADWSVSTEPAAHRQSNDRCSAGNGMYAVADGAGPDPAAGQAAELALLVLRSMWDGLPPSASALHSACSVADEVVRGAAHGTSQPHFLTTLTAVAFVGRTAHVVHVGDSAAFIVRRARPGTPTEADTPTWGSSTGALARAPRVERLTLNHSMHRSGRPDQVSRLLGQGREPTVLDVGQVDLGPHDRLLLATDGVADHVLAGTLSEVGETVADADIAARSLVRAAKTLGSTDDRTAMIIDLAEELPPGSPTEPVPSVPSSYREIPTLNV